MIREIRKSSQKLTRASVDLSLFFHPSLPICGVRMFPLSGWRFYQFQPIFSLQWALIPNHAFFSLTFQKRMRSQQHEASTDSANQCDHGTDVTMMCPRKARHKTMLKSTVQLDPVLRCGSPVHRERDPEHRTVHLPHASKYLITPGLDWPFAHLVCLPRCACAAIHGLFTVVEINGQLAD